MVFGRPSSSSGARATAPGTFKNHCFRIGKHGVWPPRLLSGGARDGPRNLVGVILLIFFCFLLCGMCLIFCFLCARVFSVFCFLPRCLLLFSVFCFLSAGAFFLIFCFLFSVRGCVFSYFLFSAFCSLVWGFAYFLISVFCLPVCVSSMWDTSHPGIRQIAVLVHDSW